MTCALVVIDVQKGIDEEAHWGGNRNNPQAEENIQELLNLWRVNKQPVVIVKHDSVSGNSPFRPGQIGNELKDFLKVGTEEKLISKSTANAFINTDLKTYLDRHNIKEVVISGFVTNNSVEATARMAGDLGFKTIVVSDATACFDKIGLDGQKFSSALVHQLSLANLKDEYATILTTAEVINRQSSI